MPDPKKKPIYVDSKNDPRYKAYQDSLNLYKAYKMQDVLMGKGSEINKKPLTKRNYSQEELKEYRKEDYVPVLKQYISKDYRSEKEFREENKKDNRFVRPEDIKLLNYYKSLGFNDNNIMYHQSPDIVNNKIRPIGSYFDGTANSPVYKKPQQPIIVQNNRKPNTTTGKQVKEDINKGMVFNEALVPNKPREKLEVIPSLTPQGIQTTNQTLNTELPQIRQVTPQPKYYNVTDKVNQNFGGSETSYKWYPENGVPLQELSNQKYDDGTPYNSRKLTPHYAYGGNLNNNMTNNKLTEFNEGGSHEQNPLGGVPLGSNASVEQNETKKGKYIYSDRLFIDENMVKEMNLPTYIKGKSFASASKAINNKFLDRDDKYSNETKNTLLKRLEQAQETVKAQDEQRAQQIAQSMQANSQQIPDMMNGEIPEGMEEYTEPQNNPQEEQLEQPQMAYGGRIKYRSGGKMQDFLEENDTLFGSVDAIGKQFQQGKTSQPGDKGAGIAKDISTTAADAFMPGAGKALGAADSLITGIAGDSKTGKGIGSMVNPLGTIKGIGAAIETGNISDMPVVGMFTGNSTFEKNKVLTARNNAINYSNQFKDTQMAYGGRIQMRKGGPYTVSGKPLIMKNDGMSSADMRFKEPIENQFNEDVSPLTKNISGLAPYATSSAFSTIPTNQRSPEQLIKDQQVLKLGNVLNQNPVKDSFITDKGLPGTWTGRQLRTLNENKGNIMKYAPVAMNAYQLATLSKPENKILQRLGNRYSPKYTDEARLQNIADQELNNNIDAYSQIGGSQGAVRNAIIASGLNKTKGLSDAYMKASEFNNAQNDKAQQFNLDVDSFNTQTQHKESENWERNKAAYDTEKSKLLGNIGNNLGNIGKEEVNKNQIVAALGYDIDGEHVVNKKTGERTLATDFYKKVQDGTINNKKYSFKSKNVEPLKLSYNPNKYNFK